jgi:D-arabinose 1-dehydrogenase-like Zn-dependent alcohol dehydrogenase
VGQVTLAHRVTKYGLTRCTFDGISAMDVRPDDEVLVLGTGTIGLLAVQTTLARTAAVDVVGIDATGRALARDLGARHTYRSADAPARHYSCAVEASGAAAAFRQALDGLAVGGRLVAIGVVDGTSVVVAGRAKVRDAMPTVRAAVDAAFDDAGTQFSTAAIIGRLRNQRTGVA